MANPFQFVDFARQGGQNVADIKQKQARQNAFAGVGQGGYAPAMQQLGASGDIQGLNAMAAIQQNEQAGLDRERAGQERNQAAEQARFDFLGKYIGGVNDENSYQQLLSAYEGIHGPDPEAPRNYDPNFVGGIKQMFAQQLATKSSPATDIDDYIADAELARQGDEQARLRNVDRMAIKRAQPAEVAATRAARSSVDLKFKPAIQSAVKLAEEDARAKGETLTTLKRAEAALPGLMDTMDTLKELAPIATSTLGGKVFDSVVKESGFGATKGSTARAKFIAIINNQVLPLLKPTFGAAFTVQEGESLKATMGDPDASPAEKIAQLESFIVQKRRSIETAQREVSTVPSPPKGNEVQEGQVIVNPTTGQRLQVVNGKLVGVQ